jgi:hypothetical protein
MRKLLLVLVLAACGSTKDNPTDVDAPPDTLTTTPPPLPSGVLATSGGGVTVSSQHRLRLRVGGSQPAGRAASAGHHLVTGPGALP